MTNRVGSKALQFPNKTKFVKYTGPLSKADRGYQNLWLHSFQDLQRSSLENFQPSLRLDPQPWLINISGCLFLPSRGSQDHLVCLHPFAILKDKRKVLLTQVTKMYISGHSWEQSAQEDVWSHWIQFCRGFWQLWLTLFWAFFSTYLSPLLSGTLFWAFHSFECPLSWALFWVAHSFEPSFE